MINCGNKGKKILKYRIEYSIQLNRVKEFSLFKLSPISIYYEKMKTFFSLTSFQPHKTAL